MRFGHTDGAAGKRVIVEHTSSNPNAPLHIGNLRNVMIGAHLARLLEAVGYDVTQSFYVNDLGAQVRCARLVALPCVPASVTRIAAFLPLRANHRLASPRLRMSACTRCCGRT
jgi:hypothetical protein